MLDDPTLEEMKAALERHTTSPYDIAIAEAIYWFSQDYHGGQSSNLYAASCSCGFKPGHLASRPDDDFLYNILVRTYARK